MNTSSLTGLVVVLAAVIWLGAVVPGWVKRGESRDVVREATRAIKQQAKAIKRSARVKSGRGARGQVQAAVQPAQRVDYRALYQAALAVDADYRGVAAPAAENTWTPRAMPAPLHTGHIGTLEQPTLASVSEMPVSKVVATETVEPQAAVTGANLDEILRRRRAV